MCRMYRLQATIANLFIVIPSNIILTAAYILTTPFRWIYQRCMNQLVTYFVSIFTLKPSFCNATFAEMLKAFPIGYHAILGADIMQMTEAEARNAVRARVKEFPIPCLRRCIGKVCCSPALVNSFPFRLGISVTVLPLLSWWLIGFVWIPFVWPQSNKNA